MILLLKYNIILIKNIKYLQFKRVLVGVELDVRNAPTVVPLETLYNIDSDDCGGVIIVFNKLLKG